MRVRAACRRGGGRHGRAIRTVRQHERGLPARTIRITSADLKKTTTTKNLPLFYFTLPNTSLYSCLSLRLPEHEGDDGSVLSRDTRHPESLISVSFFFFSSSLTLLSGGRADSSVATSDVFCLHLSQRYPTAANVAVTRALSLLLFRQHDGAVAVIYFDAHPGASW